MRNETRKAFEAYSKRIAELSGVSDARQSFAVEPSVQQRLETQMQESSEFLSRINVVGVKDLIGEKVGVGVTGPIAGRTDTSQHDRQPRDVTSLDGNRYQCYSTEYDTYLTWATLDAWARHPDFQKRLRDAIVKRQALDRIMIGFNGTSAATETDPAKNPLLQDVNIGWLHQYRLNAQERVMSSGAESGKVRVGPGGDYANLDAMVYDAVGALIDPWYRESTELVAIMGSQLMSDKYFPLINSNQPPSEQRALDLLVSQQRVGGRQAVQPPYIPESCVFITSLENLSLYYQEGGRRRFVQDNAKRKRVENYESSNDAYVIEDYGWGCLVENIELGNWVAPAPEPEPEPVEGQ